MGECSATYDFTQCPLQSQKHVYETHPMQWVINLRRACAVRVTVLGLCVCLSATILALQATRRLMSDTNSFSAIRARKKRGDFAGHSRDMA